MDPALENARVELLQTQPLSIRLNVRDGADFFCEELTNINEIHVDLEPLYFSLCKEALNESNSPARRSSIQQYETKVPEMHAISRSAGNELLDAGYISLLNLILVCILSSPRLMFNR